MTKGTSTPIDVPAEEAALKSMGLKVGMVVQNLKQKGKKGKIVEIEHEEGKSPMVIYGQTNKKGEDVQYKNRPSLITTDIEED